MSIDTTTPTMQLRKKLILFLQDYKEQTGIGMDQILINSMIALGSVAGTIAKNNEVNLLVGMHLELQKIFKDVYYHAAGVAQVE